MSTGKKEVTICKERLLTKETVVHNYQPSIRNCITKFITLSEKLETDDDCMIAWNDATKDLDEYEFEVSKSAMAAKACEKELEEYSQLYAQIEKQIKDTEEKIIKKKKQWQAEKTLRSNKEDYEVLSRKINEFSDRKIFEGEIHGLEKELQALTEKSIKTQEKLKTRTKQFHLLLHSIFELQSTFKEDEEAESKVLALEEGDAEEDDDEEMDDADEEVAVGGEDDDDDDEDEEDRKERKAKRSKLSLDKATKEEAKPAGAGAEL